MSVIRDQDSGDGEKLAIVHGAFSSLLRVSGLFAIDGERTGNDFEKLAESGILPNFAELHQVAGRHGVAFTPELVACSRHPWSRVLG